MANKPYKIVDYGSFMAISTWVDTSPGVVVGRAATMEEAEVLKAAYKAGPKKKTKIVEHGLV